MGLLNAFGNFLQGGQNLLGNAVHSGQNAMGGLLGFHPGGQNLTPFHPTHGAFSPYSPPDQNGFNGSGWAAFGGQGPFGGNSGWASMNHPTAFDASSLPGAQGWMHKIFGGGGGAQQGSPEEGTAAGAPISHHVPLPGAIDASNPFAYQDVAGGGGGGGGQPQPGAMLGQNIAQGIGGQNGPGSTFQRFGPQSPFSPFGPAAGAGPGSGLQSMSGWGNG